MLSLYHRDKRFCIGSFQIGGGRLDWAASAFAQAGALSDFDLPAPGHPLHLLLSKMVEQVLSAFELPPYLYASSLSFFSAAVTITIVYLYFDQSKKIHTAQQQICALLLCMFLATTPIFWLHATEATAFSLHTALLSGVWLLLTKHRQGDDLIFLFMATFLAALAVANHITAIFFILGIGGYTIAGQKKIVNLKHLFFITLAASFTLGLAPYIYYFPDQPLLGLSEYFSNSQPVGPAVHSVAKPLWVTSGLVGTVLLLLGLWHMVRARVYNLVAFVVINVLGHVLYGLMFAPANLISYMAPVAFLTVVCSSWSLGSSQFSMLLLGRGLVVVGLVLNLFILVSIAAKNPVVDKMGFVTQVREHLQNSQYILMERNRENHALEMYYRAVTGTALPIAWVGEKTRLASSHVAVSYLSPDPSAISTHRVYSEKPISVPSCCGLDGPITITRLFDTRYIYRVGDILKFHQSSNGRHFLAGGFNKPESWGVWSDSPRASVNIPFAVNGEGAIATDKPIKLLINLGAFARAANPEIQVRFTANGTHIADWDFDFHSLNIKNQGQLVRHVVYLPTGIAHSGLLKLDFEISGSASPEDLGLGPDPRNLGIEITEMRLIPILQEFSEPLLEVETDPIPVPIISSGLVIEIEDVFAVPRSSAQPPYAQINMLSYAKDGSKRLFVNDMRGYIYAFEKGGQAKIFLDLHSIIGAKLIRYEFEMGLIAFAFHPDFADRQAPGFGRLYTAHTEYTAPMVDKTVAYFKSPLEKDHHQDIITEWRIDPNNSDRVSPESGRELMRVGEIYRDHNVSHLGFNPNARPGDLDYGKLYIAFGDGGDGDINYADPFDMGQNPSTILGTIARIDPLAADGKPYRVPEDNPFVGRRGFLPEIWAYGFRNPLLMSWDIAGNHDLYVNDVGQHNIEEINIVRRGGNYGWSNMEGPFVLDRNDDYRLYYPPDNPSEEYILPVAMYDHTEGFAVVGGYVYRGKRMPRLHGKYIFGDIKTGRLFYIDVDRIVSDGVPSKIHELTLTRDGKTVSLFELVETDNDRVDLRIGQDEVGEIYILTKQDGMVRKLIAAPNPNDTNGQP